jgi:hypothetical protein
LVSVRAIYDDQMGVRMPPKDARERRELRELVSGREFPAQRTEELLAALPRYQVGLIVVAAPAATHLREALVQHGYSPIGEEDQYVFFTQTRHSS